MGPRPHLGGTDQRRRSAKKRSNGDVDENEKKSELKEAHRRKESSSHRNQQRDAKQSAYFVALDEEIICLSCSGIVHRSARFDRSRMILAIVPIPPKFCAPRWRPCFIPPSPLAARPPIGSFSPHTQCAGHSQPKTAPQACRHNRMSTFGNVHGGPSEVRGSSVHCPSRFRRRRGVPRFSRDF